MNWIDYLVRLIVNSALASHHRGNTMLTAHDSRLASSNVLGANEARIPSPIESELNRIENRITQIGESIMGHRASLGSVLRGDDAKAQSSSNVPREIEQSAMHARLRDFADRLENINGAIVELTDRVTL